MVAFISEKQRVRSILLFVFLFSTSFFYGSAQTITTKGPEIGMDDGARVTVLGEDDNNIIFCAVDKSNYGEDDEFFVTVYDKRSRSVVVEHEFDEDYGFSTAFMADDKVVLVGSSFNKKNKCVDFFQYAFPVMNKKKGKIAPNVTYSVPVESTRYNLFRVLRSSDGQKLAYLTYLRPTNNNAEEYTLDVMVCGVDGHEVAHTRERIKGKFPHVVKGYLANDGTVYVEEHYYIDQKETLQFVTVTSDQQYKPMQIEEDMEGMHNMHAELLADQRLMMFGAAKDGVGMIVLDNTGEVAKFGIYEVEIPDLPEGVTYDFDFYNENSLAFKPYQILSLQDGRVLVLAHRHRYILSSYGNSVTAYNDHKNLYLYLFDKELEPLTFETRPFGTQSIGNNHEDLPVAFEWDGGIRLLFNGQVSNYTGGPKREWKVLFAPKLNERCLVLGTLDDDLHFSPKIIRNPGPNVPFTMGEYFEQLLKVTDDAVYVINHRNSDNFIEEIRK